MKLGGDAANKFTNRSIASNAYGDDDENNNSPHITYKTSDQVKAYYMNKIDMEEQQEREDRAAATSYNDLLQKPTPEEECLPTGWEDRQKRNAVDAKQHGVFARKKDNVPLAVSATASTTSMNRRSGNGCNDDDTIVLPEIALVQVTTHTLEILARTLEHRQEYVSVSTEERAAFASAVKRAMDAIAKCR